MTVLVVVESMWGNTRAVAEAVQRGMGEGEVVGVGEAPSIVADEVDLLVLGGPTHAFSMSRAESRSDAVRQGAAPGHEERGIREWLASMQPSERINVATFDTRVTTVRRLPGSAAKAAGKQVRRHHLGRLVGTQSFYVDDTTGPVHEGELSRAEEWGASLARTRDI
ncbi:MAG: flavodoxin/nitric oxide synthase [Ornithinimicrobium sp.]